MSIEVMVGGQRIIVPSGSVRYVVDELLEMRMDIEQARQYLTQQRLDERSSQDLGYIDFDNLNNGSPTIFGEFYAKTVIGRKITGTWKEVLAGRK